MADYYGVTFSNKKKEISHHGIKGQRWGVRRFQNDDGTLTDAGKKRYGRDAKGVETTLRDRENELRSAKRYLEYKQRKTGLGRKFGLKQAERAVEKASKKYQEVKDVAEKMGGIDTRTTEEKNEAWYKEYQAEKDARVKQFNNLLNLPKGKDRDAKLEKVLYDSYKEGPDNLFFEVIADATYEKSGSLQSGISKTKAHEKAADDFHDANAKLREVNKQLWKEATKRAFRFSKQLEIQKRLRENSPEWKEADSAYNKALDKLSETVLRDTGIPVNKNTIEYIRYIILYD